MARKHRADDAAKVLMLHYSKPPVDYKQWLGLLSPSGDVALESCEESQSITGVTKLDKHRGTEDVFGRWLGGLHHVHVRMDTSLSRRSH